MEIKLSVDTINKVLGYLGARPYQEVFHLIDAIQTEAKTQTPEEEKKADDGSNS